MSATPAATCYCQAVWLWAFTWSQKHRDRSGHMILDKTCMSVTSIASFIAMSITLEVHNPLTSTIKSTNPSILGRPLLCSSHRFSCWCCPTTWYVHPPIKEIIPSSSAVRWLPVWYLQVRSSSGQSVTLQFLFTTARNTSLTTMWHPPNSWSSFVTPFSFLHIVMVQMYINDSCHVSRARITVDNFFLRFCFSWFGFLLWWTIACVRSYPPPRSYRAIGFPIRE